MQRYYTHYWSNTTWRKNEKYWEEGDVLHHSAGNLFRQRGVKRGDFVYALTVKKGLLYILGKMEVGEIVGIDKAKQIFGDNVWKAKDHILANAGTTEDFNRQVSVEITQRLRFGNPPKPLVFETPGLLDRETLRGVRELTRSSAELLDRELGLEVLYDIDWNI